MKLTDAQNKELDALKVKIESIERQIENAKTELELAFDTEDSAKIEKLEKAIDFGDAEIFMMVNMQAEAMGFCYNLVMDLIFDREETLKRM